MPKKIRRRPKSFFILIIGLFLLISLASIIFGNQKSKSIKPQLDSAKSAQQIQKTCQDAEKLTCYQNELSKLTKDQGIEVGESTLSSLQSLDPFTNSCHTIAHYMSREALLRDPDKFFELVDTINVSACGSGFLHGVLEAKLSFDPTLEIGSGMANEICNRGTDDYRKRMCIHFMGHLFLVDQSGDLEKSLPYCQEVLSQYGFDCYDGLFMEAHQKLALSEHQIEEAPQYSPQYLQSLIQNCQKYDGPASNGCWTEIAEPAAKTYDYSQDKIYEACQNAQEGPARNSCLLKGGTIIVTYPLEQSESTLTAICKPFQNTSNYHPCINNLLDSLMYYSTKFTQRAITICQNQGEFAAWCFTELGKKLKNFEPNLKTRQDLCQNSPGQFKSLCEAI